MERLALCDEYHDSNMIVGVVVNSKLDTCSCGDIHDSYCEGFLYLAMPCHAVVCRGVVWFILGLESGRGCSFNFHVMPQPDATAKRRQ